MTAEVVTAQAAGNTKTAAFRGRAFLLTLNQVEKWDTLLDLLTKLKTCDYIYAGKEFAPTTLHEHIHCYVHFTSSYKLSQKILDTGVHVDVARGNTL